MIVNNPAIFSILTNRKDNNFFIKGQKCSELKHLFLLVPLVSFEIEIRQRYNSGFTDLRITVIMEETLWDQFPQKDNPWLFLSGKLVSGFSNDDIPKYEMFCNTISNFSPIFYSEIGGECLFNGKLIFQQIQSQNCFTVKLNATVEQYPCQAFVGMALRNYAQQLRDELSNAEAGDIISVEANLMPPTNNQKRNYRNFFSIKNINIIEEEEEYQGKRGA